MRQLLFFILTLAVFLTGCTGSGKKHTAATGTILGDWLILYPRYEPDSGDHGALTLPGRDSIIALSGLKMISFSQGGHFHQVDSLFKAPGKWHLNPDNKNLFIRNAGKGFDFFQGQLLDNENDTMRIAEQIVIEGERVRIVWYLKRIADGKSVALFREDRNRWRKNEGTETLDQLRVRLRSMLEYYGDYYKMISRESAYFSQARVFLPFNYYQHGIGLSRSIDSHGFAGLFYNREQARQALEILSVAFAVTQRRSFPRGEDFVIEYAIFIDRLAEAISPKKE